MGGVGLYLEGLLRREGGVAEELVFYTAAQLGVLLEDGLHVQHQPGEPHLGEDREGVRGVRLAWKQSSSHRQPCSYLSGQRVPLDEGGRDVPGHEPANQG